MERLFAGFVCRTLFGIFAMVVWALLDRRTGQEAYGFGVALLVYCLFEVTWLIVGAWICFKRLLKPVTQS